MTNQLIFSPLSLVTRIQRVEGSDLITGITGEHLTETAIEVAEEWTDSHPEGQGFGSSDSTYAMKDYLDRLIDKMGAYGLLKTAFTPCLSVVKVGEA